MGDFLEKLGRMTLFFGGMMVAAGSVNRWALGRMPWDARLAAWAALAALALAVAWTFARRLPLREVAQTIDRRGETRDRFLSALTFAENGAAPEMRALALRECEAFVGSRDFRSLIRLRVPREVAWVLAPAAALAMLQWDARDAFARRREMESAGHEEVAATVQTLEQLAREAEKKGVENDDAALKTLAEKLKQSAAQLRAETNGKEEAAKAALRQLSELEQLVQEMQKPPPNATPEELKKLAQELAKTEATKDAAAAMEAGKMAEAAKALDEAGKQDAPSAEQAKQALKQALERLAQQQQLSEALQKLAREMQKDGGQGQQSGDALQKLAQILRQQKGQQGGQSQAGKSPSPQTLQDLLAALQNLKYGDGNDGQGNPATGKSEDGKGQVAIQSFAKPGDGEPMNGNVRMPTGLPGGEHDTGTTPNPFGDNADGTAKGAELALKGRLGEGESLSLSMPAAPDGSKASRRYKELYEAMAPAAQEAVMQEEIPLGSRFFIKRYFESIRP